MGKMKDIMVKRGCVSLVDSLAFLCNHGLATMFNRVVLGESALSLPSDACDILAVVSAVKAENIAILAVLLELEGVSSDTFQSCSSEWWIDSIYKDLCFEIVRDKIHYPFMQLFEGCHLRRSSWRS